MDFAYDRRTEELRSRLLHFMDEYVHPAEAVAREQRNELPSPWHAPPVLAELQAKARRQSLWNLFLPDRTYGAGLTHLQYAPLAEITGRSPHLAPAALNCAAPDTDTMALLAEFGDAEQRRRWLEPLLSGEIRSAFAGVDASADERVGTSIRRDGEEYVVSGREWYVSGAMNPECRILLVSGRTEPAADDIRPGQSLVLVPRDAPGVEIARAMTVYGYADHPNGGHAEVVFDDVRVPAAHLIGKEGGGSTVARAGLGPGRVHRCMRLLGMAERALELMCRQAVARESSGEPLTAQGVVPEWIADARAQVEQLRLLALKAAWLLDTGGSGAADAEIEAIGVAAPRSVADILDRAVQLHGTVGVGQDLPLAELWAAARALRLSDGADEVHQRSLARRELDKYS